MTKESKNHSDSEEPDRSHKIEKGTPSAKEKYKEIVAKPRSNWTKEAKREYTLI